MKLHISFLTLILFISLLFIPFNRPALAEGENAEKERNDEDMLGEDLEFYKRRGLDKAKIDAAIEKGVAFLKSHQKPDGSINAPGRGGRESWIMGNTALACFAMLKAGVDRNDKVISAGINFCRQYWKEAVDESSSKDAKLKKTYEVCCLILALEALYAPKPPQKKKEIEKWMTVPYEDLVGKNFGKARPADRALMRELVAWLLSKQEKNIWRYPGGAQNTKPLEDASNTQYVALALSAARRCKISIGAQVWQRMAEYFIREQEKDGPEVEWFRVIGADASAKGLMKESERIRKERKAFYKAQKKKKKDEESAGEGPKTYVDEEQLWGDEKEKMFARGWSYLSKSYSEEHPAFRATTGSMTTSGIAALMISKMALGKAGRWKGDMQKKGNQAIRDGCAWLATHFSVSQNPNRDMYHMYFLYGLERAGILSMCMEMGKHDWYKEGATYLLGHQQSDGSWQTDGGMGPSGPCAGTCFAILFLKRATTPVIELPPDIFTGAKLPTAKGAGKKK